MNAIEIRDLSKSYKDFNLEHMNLTLPGGYIRKRECDRDAVIEGRYRRCVG